VACRQVKRFATRPRLRVETGDATGERSPRALGSRMTGGSSGPASAGTPPTATPPTDVPARSRRSLRGLRPSWSTSLPPLSSDPRVARRPAGPPVPPRSLVDARDSLRSSSLGRAGPSPLRCSLPPGSRGGRPVPGPPGRPGARHGVVVGLTAEASLRVRTTTAGPDPRRRGQPAVARARSADHPTTTPGVGRRRPEADPETTEAVSTRPHPARSPAGWEFGSAGGSGGLRCGRARPAVDSGHGRAASAHRFELRLDTPAGREREPAHHLRRHAPDGGDAERRHHREHCL
jgi:hypothetical protein